MATPAQLRANRENATLSTGPVTESGKAASSRNRLTLGLYTRTDYVQPEERQLYKEFTETMYAELAPASLLEETLAAEIAGAAWRLRRCDAADAGLTDFDESTEKLRRSVERARAAAHTALHRSLNQLRKLQKDRTAPEKPAAPPRPEPNHEDQFMAELMAYADAGGPGLTWEEYAARNPSAARIDPEPAEAGELASNCNPSPAPVLIPRSAPCPCKSGLKYKRCCGRNAAPLLQNAA
jgi:hypothetical protein